MKKLLVTLLLVTTCATAAHAKLHAIGKGDTMHLDPASIPAKQKSNFDIFRVKCASCHTLERTLVAIQTGVAPVSGQIFDRAAAKAYGDKMLRKSSKAMTRADVKACVSFMDYLIGEAERK